MASDAGKVVPDEQAAVPKPLENTASHDSNAAEPSEAQSAKPAEQDTTNDAALKSAGPRPEEAHSEVPSFVTRDAGKEGAAVKETPPAGDVIQEDPKPAPEAAHPAPEPDTAGDVSKSAEAGPGKTSVEKVAEKLVKQVEKAEDAAVKMLAKNLDVGAGGEDSNGTQKEDPTAKAESQSDEKSPATGDKRKAEEILGLNGKKANIEAAPPAPATNGNGTVRKPGRPKKEKKEPIPAGRTARRTRSQGLVDA